MFVVIGTFVAIARSVLGEEKKVDKEIQRKLRELEINFSEELFKELQRKARRFPFHVRANILDRILRLSNEETLKNLIKSRNDLAKKADDFYTELWSRRCGAAYIRRASDVFEKKILDLDKTIESHKKFLGQDWPFKKEEHQT